VKKVKRQWFETEAEAKANSRGHSVKKVMHRFSNREVWVIPWDIDEPFLSEKEKLLMHERGMMKW
jgi:hypothetical protein